MVDETVQRVQIVQEPFQQSIEDQTFDALVPQIVEEQFVAVTPTLATTVVTFSS